MFSAFLNLRNTNIFFKPCPQLSRSSPSSSFPFVFFSSVFSDDVDPMVSVSSRLPLVLLSHCSASLSVFFRSGFLFDFLIVLILFNFCISVFSAHFPVVFNSSSSIQQLSESPLALITAWPFSVLSFEYYMRS